MVDQIGCVALVFPVRHGKASISFGCGVGVAGSSPWYLDVAPGDTDFSMLLEVAERILFLCRRKRRTNLSKPGETTRTGLVATSILGAPATRSGRFQQTRRLHPLDPAKHAWVTRVADWPHSSFHDYAARGIYPANWGCDGLFDVCPDE